MLDSESEGGCDCAADKIICLTLKRHILFRQSKGIVEEKCKCEKGKRKTVGMSAEVKKC